MFYIFYSVTAKAELYAFKLIIYLGFYYAVVREV